MWEEILSLPRPDPRLPGLLGGYLYARGIAQAATGHVNDARATLNELREFTAKVPADSPAGQNTVRDVLSIATAVLDARIASAEKREGDASALLRTAVAAEDRLAYDEPKNWFFPARQLLGAALLRDGAAGDAEHTYREDLRENPANGWSLYGLGEALKAQHRAAQAAATMRDFGAAWQRADVTITSSAF
jgi:tetratricopeptide (TPR) repeat protein